jgi:site-specific DNA-methyltransferase (adenine-specific)
VRHWIHREAGCDVRDLGGYEIILADAPWKYRVEGGRGAADKHYPTMGFAELCLLPVEKLAAPDSVLFLWGVFPMLFEAGALMKAWGFTYKNCGFAWIKTNKLQPTPFVGLGRWTRGNAEFCLMGVRGKPKRVDKAVQQIVEDNLVVAPVAAHSQKPPEVARRILRLMGDVPAIELFARAPSPGFDVWGSEVDSTVFLQPEGGTDEEAHVQHQRQPQHQQQRQPQRQCQHQPRPREAQAELSRARAAD